MFSNPMILVPLVTSPVFLIAGFILWKKPPKKINHFYGYRTKSTMSSQERWDYAQPMAGREMIFFGLAYFCTSLIGKIFDGLDMLYGVLISTAILVIGVVFLLNRLERKMRRKFGPTS